MRILLAVFLSVALLSACNEKTDDKPAQNNSGDAAKRVFDQLGPDADKRIMKAPK